MSAKLPPPDLADPQARAAYRHELKGIAIFPRFAGLAALVIGILLEFAHAFGDVAYLAGYRTEKLGWALMILGWCLLLWAIFIRTAYHRWRIGV